MFKEVTSARQIVVRRNAAIGDCIAASVVLDKLIERGYDPVYQTHNLIHCVMRRHPKLRHVEEPGKRVTDVSLDGCYEKNPNRRRLHFSSMFVDSANSQLARLGINLGPATNCKPKLRVSPAEKTAAQLKFESYPKPWVFVCPRSDSYVCRQVPDWIWNEAAAEMQGTKFWLGRTKAPANLVDLNCQHLDNVVTWLSAADLLVSVDTGPLHIAAALGIPVLGLCQASSPELHLNDQNDYMTIQPSGLDCLNCQQNVCPKPNRANDPPCQRFDPHLIAAWANAKLRAIYSENVSAVIPVYYSEPEVIQRCVESISPQVQEIIITAEAADRLPRIIPKDPKIRVVVKNMTGIGYARNCNFGAKHTTGKYILFLNDDVFLKPDAVKHMIGLVKPDTGAVAGKLFYENGTIYHAGKFRKPGERGWGHVDLRAREGSIKDPLEVENVNGAAMLIPRRAFYDVDGMDEDYFGYCSDDDTCMRLRSKGYRIFYQPHSEGTHLEGQSMKRIAGDRGPMIRQGNAVFERKWGWYWTRNANTIPGTFQ